MGVGVGEGDENGLWWLGCQCREVGRRSCLMAKRKDLYPIGRRAAIRASLNRRQRLWRGHVAGAAGIERDGVLRITGVSGDLVDLVELALQSAAQDLSLLIVQSTSHGEV